MVIYTGTVCFFPPFSLTFLFISKQDLLPMTNPLVQKRVLEFKLTDTRASFFFRDGSVVLLSGNASACFAPLIKNEKNFFKEEGVTLEVRGEAVIEVSGKFRHEIASSFDNELRDIAKYLDEERANLMAQPEDRSDRDHSHYARGPRIIIAGGSNSGKSYSTRCLLNEATRSGEFSVTYFDVDVGQQGVGCPGCITVSEVSTPLSLSGSFSDIAPVSFFFGEVAAPSPGKPRDRYLDYCRRCVDITKQKCLAKKTLDCGGAIVNTMGWTTGHGLTLLCEQAVLFNVNHIILTDNDTELEDELRKATFGENVTFWRINSTPTVAKGAKGASKIYRLNQLKLYFFGTHKAPLMPERIAARLIDLIFLDASSVGMKGKLITIKPADLRGMSTCFCAVSQLDIDRDVRKSSCAGFLVILDVGDELITFLAPRAGPLPSKFILVSSCITLPLESIPPIPHW